MLSCNAHFIVFKYNLTAQLSCVFKDKYLENIVTNTHFLKVKELLPLFPLIISVDKQLSIICNIYLKFHPEKNCVFGVFLNMFV